MEKKKVLISSGLIGIVASLSLFLGTGASKPVKFDGSTPIALNMRANYNAKKVPPGFAKKKNVETGKKLGINVDTAQKSEISEATTSSQKLMSRSIVSSQESRSIDSLTVNQELRKEGDYFVGSGGSIELSIQGKKHNLAILSSRVSHFGLKNGNNLMTGSFETEIKDDNGNLVPSTVSFASIIETGEKFFYVAMGTFEDGPVVLSFGDDSFGTQEIRDLVRGQANIEEGSLQ
ncbi:hypothetical protein [Paenibacillus alvei]|uniref:Uncharacterized protein n=1 Tax=Paenibacillus alvei TaxID=44250 RepID=A0AAP7DJ82_PAEAL|nr:hypothetical protein [Paenibacillus alvei]NOJ71319.1 hypothetical protein [Paenibacillus alvei]